jgi:hypothetical protein
VLCSVGAYLQVSNSGVLTTRRDPSKIWNWTGLPHPGLNTTASQMHHTPYVYSIVQLRDKSFVAGVWIQENNVPAHMGPDGLWTPGTLVAFKSTDGFNYRFASTVLNHTAIPFSSFGPNEHDLSLLADGKTLMAVIRPSGDGPCTTKSYRYYYQAYSSDSGLSWDKARPIEGAGCARPRLLRLEPAGPILLSGGRLCMEKTSDMFLWCARPRVVHSSPFGRTVTVV